MVGGYNLEKKRKKANGSYGNKEVLDKNKKRMEIYSKMERKGTVSRTT